MSVSSPAGAWRQLPATTDGRFWAVAVGASLATFLLLGIPTAAIPNPVFIRMTPIEPFGVATWIASALLSGPLIATYVVKPTGSQLDLGEGRARSSLAGIGAYLAIGCPICNKIIVAVLGVSGAMNAFAPIQPFLGAGSVILIALTLAWRLRLRTLRCAACVVAPRAQAAS
jgi:hypothetical protein